MNKKSKFGRLVALLTAIAMMASLIPTMSVSAQETFDLGEFNYLHSWAPGWNTDGRSEGSYPLQWETLESATQLVLELSAAPEDNSIELVRMSSGNGWSWTQSTVFEPGDGDGTRIVVNFSDIPDWDEFLSEGPGYFGLGGIGDLLVSAHLVLGSAAAPAAPVAITAPVVAPGQHLLRLVTDSTTYTLDGAQGTLEVAPVNVGGRNLVPFRFIGETMGAEVSWTPATSTAHFVLGDINLDIVMNEAIYHNGVNIGTPANVDGRVLVPVRVAEMMGAEVNFDAATRAVYVIFAAADEAEEVVEEVPAEEPAEEEAEEEDPAEEEADEEAEEEDAEEEAADEEQDDEDDDDEDEAPAVTVDVAPASGHVLRHTHGTNWGVAQLLVNLSDDDYTISFMVLHDSDEFGVQPDENPLGGWNFLDGDGEAIGFVTHGSGEWTAFAFTFSGAQTTNGLWIAPQYPRAAGSSFYLDNVVITNSAGDVVFSNDFETNTNGFSIREWSEDTQARVAKP